MGKELFRFCSYSCFDTKVLQNSPMQVYPLNLKLYIDFLFSYNISTYLNNYTLYFSHQVFPLFFFF